MVELDEVLKHTQELERIRADLSEFAGLPRVDRDNAPISPPSSLLTALTRVGQQQLAGSLHWSFMALEHALYRLKIQLAFCRAYREASLFIREHGIITRMDKRWAEHYGFAVLTLYAIWNQFASLLNEVLAWGLKAKGVYPSSIRGQAKSDLLASDTWFQALLRLYATLHDHQLDRNLEAHGRGQGHLVWQETLAHLEEFKRYPGQIQAESARMNLLVWEDEKNGSVRSQWDGLRCLYHGLDGFFDRNAADIAARFSSAGNT